MANTYVTLAVLGTVAVSPTRAYEMNFSGPTGGVVKPTIAKKYFKADGTGGYAGAFTLDTPEQCEELASLLVQAAAKMREAKPAPKARRTAGKPKAKPASKAKPKAKGRKAKSAQPSA